MSFGKLYTYPKAPRSTMALFVAKYNKLDVEICNAFPIKVYPEKGGVGEEYLSKFHTGKVPALETADGFAVYESNALAWFLAKQDPNTKLCGSGLKEETTVLRWASFTNYELLPPIMAWIGPIIGRAPNSPEILKTCEKGCELTICAIEKEIAGKSYLVGDTLTLADLFVVSGLARGYQYVFTKSWAEKHPVVHEYYMRIRNDKDGIFDSILGPNVIRDEAGGTYPDYDGL
ncbi:elongation factor EF-1 gamma subunit [Colletotrichum godetiae]|uniref:Elongation factor EF-1 gamma subunit n=1 Tax=Colletotrichum godetiae TaxID=1209918 RepID=A0AAJ0AMM4_9PEZI|nr:elongation factor EF-1 gamma subunit [Colletotrichum godetiae]KAK1676040.1 elongation factor EF-1 gamma subunit [Colletotrichum godetiae]